MDWPTRTMQTASAEASADEVASKGGADRLAEASQPWPIARKAALGPKLIARERFRDRHWIVFSQLTASPA